MIAPIAYESGSFAGDFSPAEMQEFVDYLVRQIPTFQFESAYVEHIKSFHRGIPVNKRLTTIAGKEQIIERFLNFLDTSARQNKKLGAYNVNVVWSSIDDRLGPYLVPFVALVGGDKLCFDVSDPTNHKIVCWFHELSEEDLPYTEVVADNFVEFLKML